MKQRILAMLLTGALAAGLTACGGDAPEPSGNGGGETDGVTKEELKVGFVHIGDESDMGYTYNMVQGVKEMQANLGLSDDQIITKYNIPENDACADALNDLIDRECDIIFATSFGFGDYVTMAARENPDIQFCHATGTQAHTEELPNLHNCFANIYEGRYLAGIAAGMKAKEIGNPKLGYVGAYPYAEVISGYTAFYLGAKSVYPEVTMDVIYTNTWNDASLESQTAQALIDRGCGVVSQHSDSTGCRSGKGRMGLRLQRRHDRGRPRRLPPVHPHRLGHLLHRGGPGSPGRQGDPQGLEPGLCRRRGPAHAPQ